MISVRRGTNWNAQPGYWWTCTIHQRHRGFHRFDRFTDRVRYTPDRHPWERAMSAAVCHFHLYHRARSPKAAVPCAE